MRPKIICHMASSIDGRLLVARWTPLPTELGPKFASICYESVASKLEADGFIIGRTTMQEFAGVSEQPPSLRSSTNPRPFHRAQAACTPVAVVVDPQGKLHYKSPSLQESHVVAVLSERVSDFYLDELKAVGISYLFAGPDGMDLQVAMLSLGTDFQVRKILLEGGGRINGAFLKAGLIDELSVLVYPCIDGLSGVPSIVDYVGNANERPALGSRLCHQATEVLDGGVTWLRYSIDKDPASVH
ncbi:dihydrofolate reductase family protein [Variovorax saccharolyticus]|uniref:dihydrofolate reductase family protein n=1 Tax=Variovorax saccharolyticus TaxID=3053516 RepID=UPI00257676DA|nr:dihydrofolate reductase family protein [Variovorax sp. J22R187]MDM0021834.1 dihydrofolate reductase family protein [Variovorax sp. J22R187]